MTIQDHFRTIASLDPGAEAIYFDDKAYSWGSLLEAGEQLGAALDRTGVPKGAAVGWVARNDPAMVAAALGLLISGRCLCPLNPMQPPEKLAQEISGLAMPAIVAPSTDWTDRLKEAVAGYGGVGFRIDLDLAPAVRPLAGLSELGEGPFRSMPGAVLERMSSGTTGDPKRMQMDMATLEASLIASRMAEGGAGPSSPKLHRSPAIHIVPFSHSSGIFRLLMVLYQGRPMVLFEKFDAQKWSEAVKRFKPKVASLVPAMIGMVMDRGPKAEDLASLICIRSGTAPLDPKLRRTFEEKYGIPILTEYGATEFVGGIAGWTLEAYRRYGADHPRSVGFPKQDVEVEIVDPESGAPVAPGCSGLLRLKAPRWGGEWIATTDLASLDALGLLYIDGRADEAINRGGFKILPEKVAEVMRGHPAVQDACILGVRDPRLGQLPLAVVELRPGRTPPDAGELLQWVRDNLPAYCVPTAVEIIDELPRTPSMKIARASVRQRFAGQYVF